MDEDRLGTVLDRVAEGHSYDRIGADLGISRQRVGAIIRRAVGVLDESRARPIQHGTVYAYRIVRCRCSECRAANAAANRRYKASKEDNHV